MLIRKKAHKDHRNSALLNHLKFKTITDTGNFHSCNHQKWISFRNLGDKTVNNVQIDGITCCAIERVRISAQKVFLIQDTKMAATASMSVV